MKKLTRKEVQPLLIQWKNRLGLSDWLIAWEIRDFEDDPDTLAFTIADRHDMRAKIVFRTDLHARAEGAGLTLRGIVIHELLHVKLAHLVDYAKHVALEIVGGTAGDHVLARLHDENERLVDNLSINIDGWAK